MGTKPGIYKDQDKLNWEVEKLKAECHNLSISFWTAIALALIGVVGTGANIYFNKIESTLSEIKKENLDKEAKALDEKTKILLEDKKRLEKERDALQAEKAQISQELEALSKRLSDKKEEQNVVNTLVTNINSKSNILANQVVNLPARVYLQFLESQKNQVAPIIEKLENQGYLVFPNSTKETKRERNVFIGYYYDSEQTEATNLQNVLQTLVPTLRVQPPKLIKGGARPGHYDVWIAFP